MLHILRQPFPSDKKTIHALRMCIMASSCVWAVFFFIKPFGLGLATDAMAATTGLKFALVTLILSLFCTIVVPFLLPALFDEKHWTVLMEMIFLLAMVLLIAMGNVWLTTWLFGNPLSAGLVVNTIKYTLVIGSAPVLLSVLIKQQRLLAKYSLEARQIEESIGAAPVVTAAPVDGVNNNVTIPSDAGDAAASKEAPRLPGQAQSAVLELPAAEPSAPVAAMPPLHLKGDNLSENLQLAAADFLFAAAADNYTTIYYLKDGVVQQVLFRVSVKSLAEQAAAATTSIFRCHKSFLVNLQQVAHISGNAQGYKLHLLQNEFTVPVSRSLNGQIKQQLQELHPKK